MSYRLTETTDITNAGANVVTTIFDTYYELTDYVTERAEGMSDDARELYFYHLTIEEL